MSDKVFASELPQEKIAEPKQGLLEAEEKKKEELELKKEKNEEESDGDEGGDSEDDGEHDENFIKQGQEVKDENDDERSKEEEEKETTPKGKLDKAFANLTSDVKEAIAKINEFLSKKNQQRNLDRETGGLETEQKEVSSKDVWDERSEEVDKMGDYDIADDKAVSMVWAKAAKDKKMIKKLSKKAAQEAMESGGAIGLAALGEKKLSMTEKLKLRQDRSHESGGEGMWR